MGAYAPLVSHREFILATRDTGYRSTAAAVAELIDNSLQSGAQHVNVEVRDDRGSRGRAIEISVLDDGGGMSSETLQRALQFGGTSRFDDRNGVGRFGMGLPNSSLSQAKRVDVYSWQSGAPSVHTYIDVDEVVLGRLDGVPQPVQLSLPSWAIPHATGTGTLVVWSNCDRLGNKKASTVAAKLSQALGQIYRYFLWADASIWINGNLLRAVDPLFHQIEGLSGCADLLPPLTFVVETPKGAGGASVVQVRFSSLPIESWSGLSVEEKRSLGISGGAGVSVVRAGREVAYGWYLMGGKRRENYDDWWRCEVRFEPALDEEFGVTHSKQGITPSAMIASVLSPTLEGMARDLNRNVRERFVRVKQIRPSVAAVAAGRREPFLPPIHEDKRKLDRGPLEGYTLESKPLRTADFYTAERSGGVLAVTLNRSHPFYEQVYVPLERAGMESVRAGIESLLLASARADLEAGDAAATRRRHSWSDALATFLGS